MPSQFQVNLAACKMCACCSVAIGEEILEVGSETAGRFKTPSAAHLTSTHTGRESRVPEVEVFA